jgi:hypothetical protein
MESTFHEKMRRRGQYLGFETQRHWSKRAIQRTAPALLRLLSLVALFAHQQRGEPHRLRARRPGGLLRRQTSSDLLSDALALVRNAGA